MKKKSSSLLFSLLALLGASEATAAMNYEAYLESWDSNYIAAYQGLPPAPDGTPATSYQGVTLDIGFAAYDFTKMYNPSGLNGTQFNSGMLTGQDAAVSAIISFVHNHGGLVKISYGGASYAAPWAPNYFISQTAGWPGNSATLAAGVVDVVNILGLDGVDFDIEDPQPGAYTAQQFAQQLTTFLQSVRSGLGPDKVITLTIPGQGWGTYWQYLAQNVAAISGLVNAINFMEYDIWVNDQLPGGYPEQINADMTTYTSPTNQSPAPNWSPGWGIPPGLIQVGMMPGNDDQGHLLTPAGATTVTRNAMSVGLSGVMIWDIDRDAAGTPTPPPPPGYSPYEFSQTIRGTLTLLDILAPGGVHPTYQKLRTRQNRATSSHSNFIRQPVPPHGNPGTM